MYECQMSTTDNVVWQLALNNGSYAPIDGSDCEPCVLLL